MKQFIVKSFAFLTILAFVFYLFWVLICSTRPTNMKLPESERIVFLGNSRIEYAINDTILKNSFNFGRSAEPMECIYSKTILLQQYNPHLDTIIIEFDNYLLCYGSNKGIHPKLYSPYFFDTYTLTDLFQMTITGSFEFIASHLYHPFQYLKLTDFIPSYIGYDCNVHDLNALGGFNYSNRDKLELDINIQKKSKKEKNDNNTIHCDSMMCYFLDETIRFCKENDITVIFLSTPIHHKFSDSNYYKQFHNAHYSDIPFYDFQDMALPDSCFGDMVHLNHKGAAVFSEYLERNVFHKNNYPKADSIN